jgi:hypothetical protein
MFIHVFDFLKPTMNWSSYKHVQSNILKNIHLFEKGSIPVNKVFGKGLIPTSYIQTSVQNCYGVKHVIRDGDVITYIDSEQYPLSDTKMHVYLCLSARKKMGTYAFHNYISYIRKEYPTVEKITLDAIDVPYVLRFYKGLGFTECNECSTSFVPMQLVLIS